MRFLTRLVLYWVCITVGFALADRFIGVEKSHGFDWTRVIVAALSVGVAAAIESGIEAMRARRGLSRRVTNEES